MKSECLSRRFTPARARIAGLDAELPAAVLWPLAQEVGQRMAMAPRPSQL